MTSSSRIVLAGILVYLVFSVACGAVAPPSLSATQASINGQATGVAIQIREATAAARFTELARPTPTAPATATPTWTPVPSPTATPLPTATTVVPTATLWHTRRPVVVDDATRSLGSTVTVALVWPTPAGAPDSSARDALLLFGFSACACMAGVLILALLVIAYVRRYYR